MNKRFTIILSAILSTVAVFGTSIFAIDVAQGENNGSENVQAVSSSEAQSKEAQKQAYAEYFSVERPFYADETPMDDGDYVCSFDLDAQTLTVKNKLTGETSSPLKGIYRVWRYGNDIYAYLSPNVVKYDLETGQSEVIFKAGDIATVSELDSIGLGEVDPSVDFPFMHINPELIYFIKGTSVHRYHIPSQIEEIVYQDDKIVSFNPLSNNKMIITKMNPEWEKCVAETGNKESGIPECLRI